MENNYSKELLAALGSIRKAKPNIPKLENYQEADNTDKLLDIAADMLKLVLQRASTPTEVVPVPDTTAQNMAAVVEPPKTDDKKTDDEKKVEDEKDLKLTVDNEPQVHTIIQDMKDAQKLKGDVKTNSVNGQMLDIMCDNKEDYDLLSSALSFYIVKDVPEDVNAMVKPENIGKIESIKCEISGVNNGDVYKKELETLTGKYKGVIHYVK